MTYLDFSGLLILAVTCNLIYIVFGRNDDMLYYRFLKNIDPATHIFSKFNIRSQELMYITSTVDGIKEDIKNSDSGRTFKGDVEDNILKKLFNRDFKKAKKLLEAVIIIMKSDKRIDTIREKMNSEKAEYEKTVKRFKNISNLQYISIISFLYSFYILIITPYGNIENFFTFDLNNSFCIMNLVMIVMSLMYIFMDIFQKIRVFAASLIIVIIVNLPTVYFLYKFYNVVSIWVLSIITFLVIFALKLFDGVRFKNLILCTTFVNLMIILAILNIDNNSIIKYYIKIIGGAEKNYFITVLICFIGFILYFIPSVICWIYSLFFSLAVLRKNEDIKNVVDLLDLFVKHEERIQPYIQEKAFEKFSQYFSRRVK